ncbi:hypothetical protein BT93_G1188 [Corymbia citriodora subsp. variegata]|nr:hypothetical protein BT93_G1188 [Corymbia citriodora subsp. variegata]
MTSPKKLLKVARKWEISAASGRKRIALAGARVEANSTSTVTKMGHFVIYATYGSQLFKMSKEEFGLSSDGPITKPSDAASMENITSLVQRRMANDIEKVLLNSIAFFQCSAASLHSEYVEGVLVCG